MKKSVWNPKLWQKKFEHLPIKNDVDLAWQQMNALLDQHFEQEAVQELPAPKPGLITQLIKLIKWGLPVLCVVGSVYFVGNGSDRSKKGQITKKKSEHTSESRKVISNKRTNDSVLNTFSNKKTADHAANLSIVTSPLTKHKATKVLNSVVNVTQCPEGALVLENNIEAENAASGTIDSLLVEKAIVKAINRPEFNMALYFVPPKLQLAKSGQYDNGTSDVGKQQISPWLKYTGIDFLREKLKFTKRSKRPDSIKKTKAIVDFNMHASTFKKSVGKFKEKTSAPVLPDFSYGFEGGTIFTNDYVSPYLGIQLLWQLKQQWLIGTGLRSSAQQLAGTYEHPGFSPNLSTTSFQIVDNRKQIRLEAPLHIAYKAFNAVYIKGEANLSASIKQSGGSRVAYVANLLDTVFHSKQIEAALSNSTVNKFNLDIGTGFQIHLRRFNMEVMYLYQPIPYEVVSDLGTYRKHYRSLRLGLGYLLR